MDRIYVDKVVDAFLVGGLAPISQPAAGLSIAESR